MNGEAKSSMVQEVGEIAWALIGGVCGALVADRLVDAGMRTERAARSREWRSEDGRGRSLSAPARRVSASSR